MHCFLPLATLITVATASAFARSSSDPDRYTVCGADRGYTEKDSLDAASYLVNNVTLSNEFFMAKEDCIYAHVNSTIISLCNGAARNRTINRGEVQRGINQLIKDCGLQGGFTGVHVVNNLTFAAYGVFGGISLAVPGGSPPPDTPGGGGRKLRREARSSHLSKRSPCDPPAFNGSPSYDCPKPEGHALNPDGSCGTVSVNQNQCQTYCEVKRTGFLGIETNAPGAAAQRQPPDIETSIEAGYETSITTGFSIGADGVYKDAMGVGVSFQWSITKTITHTVAIKGVPSPDWWSRWVFFPNFIETCGSVSKKTYVKALQCHSKECTGYPAYCDGEQETIANVCSLTPYLDSNGNAMVYWALRYENEAGEPAPLDQQSASYKALCNTPDPDHDGQNECSNVIGTRMPMRNFEAEKRAMMI